MFTFFFITITLIVLIFFELYYFYCSQSYPVKSVIPEITGQKLSATKGFIAISKLIWAQTKPIFVAPYGATTLKLSYMIFILFFVEKGTFLW